MKRIVLKDNRMVEIGTDQTETVAMCEHCIDYFKTQGYKLLVGDEVDAWDEDAPTTCDWCEEEGKTLYEVIW